MEDIFGRLRSFEATTALERRDTDAEHLRRELAGLEDPEAHQVTRERLGFALDQAMAVRLKREGWLPRDPKTWVRPGKGMPLVCVLGGGQAQLHYKDETGWLPTYFQCRASEVRTLCELDVALIALEIERDDRQGLSLCEDDVALELERRLRNTRAAISALFDAPRGQRVSSLEELVEEFARCMAPDTFRQRCLDALRGVNLRTPDLRRECSVCRDHLGYQGLLAVEGDLGDECSEVYITLTSFETREEALASARSFENAPIHALPLSGTWRYLCSGKTWNKYADP